MISSKRLAQMARKWMRAAAAGRKRISFHRAKAAAGGSAAATTEEVAAASDGGCGTSAPARKGHFVVYSSDGRRYEMPLAYLKNGVVTELLRISEEVLGLPVDGPITLPWDPAFVGSVVSCIGQLMMRRSPRDAEARAAALLLAEARATRSCRQEYYCNSMGPCNSFVVNGPVVACEC